MNLSDTLTLQRQMDEVFMQDVDVMLGIDIQALLSIADSIKRNAKRLDDTAIKNINGAISDLEQAIWRDRQ